MFFLSSVVPDPIAIAAGPMMIRWYAVFMTLGVLAGLFLFRKLGRERGISDTTLLDIALWTLLLGFLGGRLYHVLNEPAYYSAHPGEILAVWNGGLAVHGGMLGGGLTLWWFARRAHLSFLTLLDTVAPALLLGQAIGRWGNYFNQELFGTPTDLPWKLFISPEHRPAGYEAAQYFHPTFLYESLGLLVIVAVLLFLRKRVSRIPGSLALLALLSSQILRFSTELIRIDQTPILLGVRLPVLVSAAFILLSIIVLIPLTRHATPQKN